MSKEQGIGVALSGGGHRATLFGLGALLYLADADSGPRLRHISSVSGGSLTNAFMGQMDLSSATPQQVWDRGALLARQIVRRGTVWAAPITYAYLALFPVLLAVAWYVGHIGSSCAGWIGWIAAISLCGWLSRQRSRVASMAFDATLLHGCLLKELDQRVAHVLCATDIQTGNAVYFSGGFVYSWRSGWGEPRNLRASRAAQASAALPGAFPVVSLPLKRFGLPEGRVAGRTPPRRFALLDGGVYDNMGTEWLINLSDRLRDGAPPADLADVAEVVVVNASSGDGVTRRRGVTVPVIGELVGLLAAKDVMYRQTTAVRRRLLDAEYRRARSTETDGGNAKDVDALRGSTIQINRSPFALPDVFSAGHDEIASRARAAVALLGDDNREIWNDEVELNRAVKTTLSRIDARRAEWLVRHAYVLTMTNCHVLLGYPLLPLPSDERLHALVDS